MKKEWLGVCAIFALAFLAKMYFLLQDPLIAGMDAGYYVAHINEVLATGYQTTYDPPLIYYYGALFAAALGDTIFGFKVGIALLSAGMAIPFYLLVRKISGRGDAALAAAFLGAFSPSNMRLMVDLFKNVGGLFLGMLFICFLLEALERKSWRDAGVSAAFYVLMLLTHYASTAYISAAAVPLIGIVLVLETVKERKVGKRALICVAFILLMALATAYSVFLRPDIVGDEGIGVVGGQGEGPQAAARGLFSFRIFELYLLFIPFALLGLYSLWSERKLEYLLLFLPWLALSLLLAQPFVTEWNWVWRFELMAYMPVVALSCAGLGYFKRKDLALGAALLLIVYSFSGFVAEGGSFHSLITLEEYKGLEEIHSWIPDAEVLGAQGGMAYWLQAAGFKTIGRPGLNLSMENLYFVSGAEMGRGGPPDARLLQAMGAEFYAQAGRFGVYKVSRLPPPPLKMACGNGRCELAEDCARCPVDCPCDRPESPVCAPLSPLADLRGCGRG